MKWISVKERLPDDSRPVLCKVKLGGEHTRTVHFEASYWKDADKYEWSDWCGYIDFYGGWKVTHWMEIPE